MTSWEFSEITPAYTRLHGSFWTNEGTEELRVCIKGLVTTTFKGNAYQTPIVVWMSNRYPQTPPDFYVDTAAAPNMIVPQDHPCISPDGQVRSSRMPSLHSYCTLLLQLLLSSQCFFVLILPFLQVRHPHMTMWADSHRHGLRCHASIPLTPPLPPNLNVTATTQPQRYRYDAIFSALTVLSTAPSFDP